MFIVINTTTNKKNIAKAISKRLINMNLSPCISVIPNVESSYIWDNKINNEYEYLVSIKTVDILKNKIVEIIKQIHNYKVPEIISYKINIINKDYKLWCEDIIKT